MRSNKMALALLALALVLTSVAAGAATVYVSNVLGSDTTGDGSLVNPYATIQKGIDAAVDGDAVFVLPGAYLENIIWDTKSIALVGVAGAELTVVESKIERKSCLLITNVVDGRLSGITFQNATSVTSGAGVAVAGSVLSITGCEMSGNSADQYGGGLYLSSSVASLIGNAVVNNRVSGSGGGVYAENSAVELRGNLIRVNASTFGGGVNWLNSTVTLVSNRIFQNRAERLGGGVYASGSATLQGNEIQLNLCSRGGGVYLENSSAFVDGNLVAYNGSAQGGGFLVTGSPGAVLTNNIVVRNKGTENGGGLYLRSSNSTLTNNTVAGNVGGGVFGENSSPTVTNCILWGNGSYDLSGATATYSDIGTGETSGDGNISADPLFVGPGETWNAWGQFDLSIGSPCINVGNNAAPGLPTTDVHGAARVLGGTVDMGADETVAPPQPDFWIKKGTTWLGNDVYNSDGTDQTVTIKVAAGATATHSVRLYNDGGQTDTFWVKGTKGSDTWTVRYFQGTTEVTTQVTSKGGWKVANLAPGAFRALVVKATPQSGVASGQKLEVLVTVKSALDASKKDAVKAVTQVK